MRGVELPLEPTTKLDLKEAIANAVCFGGFKGIMAGRIELVLEGYPVVERVTRHSSVTMIERLEARQNFIHLDFSADERLEKGRALRASEWTLNAVARIRFRRQILEKGAKVFLEGAIRIRKWQDQSGGDRYSAEIHPTPYKGIITPLDRKSNTNPPKESPIRGLR